MTFLNSLRFALVALAFSLGGCASTGDPRDPFEPLNRGIYTFNDTVDKAVTKPIAQGYRAVLPSPVRTGVSNFFSNIDDIFVTANNLLQFKFHTAASDFTRLLANTTLGIGGLFDVASGFGLPKHNEDLGQTFGYWGIGDGPFLMLPLLGPSNVRDAVGSGIQTYADPVWNLNNVAVRNSLAGLRVVNSRANLLDAEKVLDEAALDPYTFLRDSYIQQRRSLIYDGNPPREKLSDFDDASDHKNTAATSEAVTPSVVASEVQGVVIAEKSQVEKVASVTAPVTEKTVEAEPGNILVSLISSLFSGNAAAGQE